jgi:hypothetical protein
MAKHTPEKKHENRTQTPNLIPLKTKKETRKNIYNKKGETLLVAQEEPRDNPKE